MPENFASDVALFTRVDPKTKKSKLQNARYLRMLVWVPLISMQSFSLVASAKKLEATSKVYIVGYTNKTGDLEAVFEISYF